MEKRKTRYVILGLLLEGSLSGYDIKKIIDTRFSFFWSESYGQLYPELKKMTEEGLLTSLSEENNRGRQVYSVTEKGVSALKSWLKEPPERASVRLEILLKMYFSSSGDTKDILSHLERFAEENKKNLAVLGLCRQELLSIDDPFGNHGDILLTVECGLKVYRAYIDWAEETLKHIQRRTEK